MPQNSEIAALFDELADLLEIENANPFRVRAYRAAARLISGRSESVCELLGGGRELPPMRGIGADLAGKIREICETGGLPLLDETRRRVPAGLSALLRIPGLGPRRVRMLQQKLRISDLAGLERALLAGRVGRLRGFGPKLCQTIQDEMARSRNLPQRLLLPAAEEIAAAFLKRLRALPEVERAEAAGSLRRHKESVGDIDLLAACAPGKAAAVMNEFLTAPDVREVLSHGRTRSSIRLGSGAQVDLRVVAPSSFGAALHYFTGSKAHNIAIRWLGKKRGLKINEYGIFRGPRRVSGRTEEEVFEQVGLPYIEPELRENSGEIEAARARALPRLVTLKDLRGDLHAHTNETDGRLPLAELARIAEARGYEYLAVTDHTKHLTVARGMDAGRFRRQFREIDRINARLSKLVLLKGAEVDILESGKLDLPDSLLRELDVTVCSVHSRFHLPREQQTERILRAMDNPCFNILGHPSGRLIGRRAPYEIDLERIVGAARERGCFLELNSQPDRLDLNDVQARMAKRHGVLISIDSDAHSENETRNLRYGIWQARRAWLEPGDILNCRTLAELKKLLWRR